MMYILGVPEFNVKPIHVEGIDYNKHEKNSKLTNYLI